MAILYFSVSKAITAVDVTDKPAKLVRHRGHKRQAKELEFLCG